MRFATTLAAAAVLSTVGTATIAGSPAPAPMEPPVVIVDDPEPAGTSINATYVIVGVLAALLIAAAANAD